MTSKLHILTNPDVIYTPLCTVQQIYYIHNGAEKQVLTYFVQFCLYRNVIHVVHVAKVVKFREECQKIRSHKSKQNLTDADSNPRSMDRNASMLTIQPLMLLGMSAILHHFNLN